MPGPADLDLRVVRYFVTVAEHRHFGRAAAALHMTQPSLSRQIRGLEKQLGATLFERTAQGSVLTAAGATFAGYAKTLLETAADAAAHTRAAAAPRRIVIGYTTNLVVSSAVRELRRRCPDAEVTTAHLPWNGARPALVDHRVDVAVTRLPIPTDGIQVTVLYREPRAVLLARHHRLAMRDELELSDIAAEPMPRTGDAAWDTFWRAETQFVGRTEDGPVIEEVAELADYVASGAGVLIAPADSRLPDLHPDLLAVPLRDVEPAEVALARRAGETSDLVSIFAECAVSHIAAGTPSRRPG
ncbi:LysR family transcriptional regulator [Mycolicibacterium aichiense]|uniref:Probable hydrogen peroxide-inducible genes activator n=1 Tax=Mycolicibacterium aichiense TaxID=1799 RepID=A0AAD1MD48_9MYCO|nr:LysR family transcriptional regulator [Mycolicibacterium aichiense]MCV7017395.1 LysR family transcriptional regulator [Mycolicibacterium aichiense]BBX10172.1 LysR family transcriptional regulator [Mycolicibacterium aichiense]STZ26162.1 LysR family transcriptional regulator [Mycolicibacterium aichiense]